MLYWYLKNRNIDFSLFILINFYDLICISNIGVLFSVNFEWLKVDIWIASFSANFNFPAWSAMERQN